MTMEHGTNTVPAWFHDFALANEKAHADLAQAISGVRGDLGKEIAGYALANEKAHSDLGSQIASVRGELRIIKATTIAIAGAVFVGVLKYLIGF